MDQVSYSRKPQVFYSNDTPIFAGTGDEGNKEACDPTKSTATHLNSRSKKWIIALSTCLVLLGIGIGVGVGVMARVSMAS